MCQAPPLRAAAAAASSRDGHVLYWWVEILAILVFYVVYSRDPEPARRRQRPSAARVRSRRARSSRSNSHLGIYHEQTIQTWALHFRPLIIVRRTTSTGRSTSSSRSSPASSCSGSGATTTRAFATRSAIATALALIGFIALPADAAPPARRLRLHGFVDTLLKDPAFWSFDSGGMQQVSNQFAAMPSVHICWSLVVRGRAGAAAQERDRVGASSPRCYPVITLIVIVHHREPLLPRRGRRPR